MVENSFDLVLEHAVTLAHGLFNELFMLYNFLLELTNFVCHATNE